jgi:hypothetical protein
MLVDVLAAVPVAAASACKPIASCAAAATAIASAARCLATPKEHLIAGFCADAVIRAVLC